MIVGVCGFGSTGSGAVMDLLREYDEVSAGRNMELAFLYDADGVLDLEQALVKQPIRFYSGDAAIKKFRKIIYSYDLTRYVKKYMSVKTFRKISDDYINDLTCNKFEGALWHYDRRQANRLTYIFKYIIGGKYLRVYDKLGIKQPQSFFGHHMYLPVHDDRFYSATKKYTSRLLDTMCGRQKQILAIDQPFPSNNPELCFKFFEDDCKAIIVVRDPRDLYLLSKKNPYAWEMRFTPTFYVEDFIAYYRDQMNLIKDYSDDVLLVRFEDLIYDYENEVSKIEKFLGIKNHVAPKKKFDPAISIANTQIALRYPELKNDIDKIEKELPEFLYPFDSSRADLHAKLWTFKKDE